MAVYIGAGVITASSLIFGYANYQATYFKDMEIKNLKTQLEDANTKLQGIDVLETQVKELEVSLAAKSAVKPAVVKKTKVLAKKETKKLAPTKKTVKKTKLVKSKEKKQVKK